jgi:hypothetical protein
MAEQTETAVEVTEPTSKEDNFFGIRTTFDEESGAPAVKEVSDDPEVVVEVVADTEDAKPKKPEKAKEVEGKEDDELENYSERVQKRIKKLTYKSKEAERQQQEAEAQRDEAIRFATGVNQQNTNYENIIHDGEARLVAQFKQSANLAVEKAREAYRKAYEAGDTDGIVEAQEQGFVAQAELQTAVNYDADYQRRSQQFVSHRQQQAVRAAEPVYQQPAAPAAPVIPEPTEEATDWAAKNKWFGSDDHRDMTAIAYATHETLVRDQGVTPDSDEYYQEIDKVVQTRFPEYFTGNDTPHVASTVVAPADRTGSKKPRSIRLNHRQVALAKKLGITPEQYAVQAAKGQ